MFTDLWIRDKYSGSIHKIGSDTHDCLMVDEEGTVHYHNLQCGDGCIGYKSVNKTTLSEEFPDTDWDKRKDEFCYGYEFVPNMDEHGYPMDPTKEIEEACGECQTCIYGVPRYDHEFFCSFHAMNMHRNNTCDDYEER